MFVFSSTQKACGNSVCFLSLSHIYRFEYDILNIVLFPNLGAFRLYIAELEVVLISEQKQSTITIT